MKGGRGRVDHLFRRLKREGRCGLIAYVTCGYPNLSTSRAVVEALEAAGADAIELGVPFSDPIADGPVIQESSQKALEAGTTLFDCLALAEGIRSTSEIPLILFSYLNPLMSEETAVLAQRARESGIDSVLITDLPPEDSAEVREPFRREGLGTIFLLTPTSSPKRRKLVDAHSDGFVYYVSTTGVTGARSELDSDLAERLDEARKALKNPLAVGFGVSRHEHYEALRDHCDAVVVGSAIVRAIGDGPESEAPERAAAVVRSILGRA